jgi:hypothetical protein
MIACTSTERPAVALRGAETERTLRVPAWATEAALSGSTRRAVVAAVVHIRLISGGEGTPTP